MRFSVVLRVGESVISPGGEGEGDVTFGSKREAKEAVAAKGVEVLKDVPVPGAGPGGAGAPAEENWVGKLAGTKAIILIRFGSVARGSWGGWLVKLSPHPSPFDRPTTHFALPH